MEITVPLSYGERYLPPRCRNHREVALLGSVPVVVQEATAQEAPVALRVTVEGRWSDEEPVTTEYRWWSGKLWTKHERCGEVGLTDYLAVRDRYSWRNADAVDRSVWCAAQPKNTVVETKGFEAAASRAYEAAADILLVDGEAWGEADEPYLTVTAFNFGQRNSFNVRSASPDRADSGRWSGDDYRIDQAALATERVQAKDGRVDIGKPPGVEVLIPEALRLDPQASALAQACEKVRQDVRDAVQYSGLSGFGQDVKARETAAALRHVLGEVEAGTLWK